MSYRASLEGAKVKKLLASLKGNELFCDPDFPASNESLFQETGKELPTIRWKRPHELVAKPQIFVDGVSRSDVKQGNLGDCWFLAACSAVAMRPELLKQVIPETQVLYGEGYKGLVTFRFWRMGTWVTINIDDRLPVDDDDDLYYARCKDPNEFWLPLLEKGFAKFHGNYQNLSGGQLPEGLLSLTGFIAQALPVEAIPKNELFEYMRQEFKNGSLITCQRGSEEREGLLTDHGYTITGARRLKTADEGVVRLVRVRNPWGQTEWVGAWDDSDSRWKSIDESIKIEMEYHPDNDGEFWIKMAHFSVHFTVITFASKIPDYDDDFAVQHKTLFAIHNVWQKGRTAGGSLEEDVDKFATNPQYLLTVNEPDDGEECTPGDGDEDTVCEARKKCGVVIELIQEHNRKKFPSFFPIAVNVFPYKKSKPYKRLTAGDFKEIEPLEDSMLQLPMSSVVCRLELDPGVYVAVPNTSEADMCRDFLLRVYGRKPVMVKELS